MTYQEVVESLMKNLSSLDDPKVRSVSISQSRPVRRIWNRFLGRITGVRPGKKTTTTLEVEFW